MLNYDANPLPVLMRLLIRVYHYCLILPSCSQKIGINLCIPYLELVLHENAFICRKQKSKKSSKKKMSPLAVSSDEDKAFLMKDTNHKDHSPLFYIAEDETDNLLKSEHADSANTKV